MPLSPEFLAVATQFAPLAAYGALLVSLVLLVLVVLVSRRVAKLSVGEHGSLEKTLASNKQSISELQTFRRELEGYLKNAEARLKTSVRGVGVVRFNAYQNGAGGNQSFAIALLDENRNGVVFSTLYSRDRVSVYAKPITNNASTFTLTTEEQEAVAKAGARL